MKIFLIKISFWQNKKVNLIEHCTCVLKFKLLHVEPATQNNVLLHVHLIL